jgi:hypothetical protein
MIRTLKIKNKMIHQINNHQIHVHNKNIKDLLIIIHKLHQIRIV